MHQKTRLILERVRWNTHAYFHGVESNLQVAPLRSVVGVLHQFLSKEGRTEAGGVAVLPENTC